MGFHRDDDFFDGRAEKSRRAARLKPKAELTPNQKFVGRLARVFDVPPARVPALLAHDGVFTGRLNRLKSPDRAAFYAKAAAQGLNLTPLPWFADGFTFTASKAEVAAHPLFAAGEAFIQNAASFLPVLALEPKPGEFVFDACSAPGAKASLVASLTGGRARLWLNDGILTRLPAIGEVQKLLGFEAEKVTSFPAQYIDTHVTESFDKIMLDAQCSGEGMVDLLHPLALEHWAMPRIAKYHHLQTKMLKACFKLLKPGGVLAYSTCTFAPEENEGPVSKLLRDNPDAAVEPLVFDEFNARPGLTRWEDGLYLHPQAKGGLRLLPGGGMEGFFVCRIRKLGGGLSADQLQPFDLKKAGAAY